MARLLTDRQSDLIDSCLARGGMTAKEIAAIAGCSPHTVYRRKWSKPKGRSRATRRCSGCGWLLFSDTAVCTNCDQQARYANKRKPPAVRRRRLA